MARNPRRSCPAQNSSFQMWCQAQVTYSFNCGWPKPITCIDCLQAKAMFCKGSDSTDVHSIVTKCGGSGLTRTNHGKFGTLTLYCINVGQCMFLPASGLLLPPPPRREVPTCRNDNFFPGEDSRHRKARSGSGSGSTPLCPHSD